MKHDCPMCGGKGTAFPTFTYPSRRSITYKQVQVICTGCGSKGEPMKNIEDAVRSFEEGV